MHRTLSTRTVANTLKEIDANCDYVRTRIETGQIVHCNLVGISKVKNGFLKAQHRTNIQWLKKLVVKITV